MPVNMYDVADALAAALQTADPAAREALREVIEAYAKRYPRSVDQMTPSAKTLFHAARTAVK